MSELKKTTDHPDQESGKKKRYLITYQNGTINSKSLAEIHNIPEGEIKEGVTFLSTNTELTDDHKLHFYELGISSISLTLKEATNLYNKKEVLAVEEDIEINILGFPSEIDPNTYDNQVKSLWNIEDVKAPEAWESGTTGIDVNLAILDTGIANHPDLIIAGGISFIPGSDGYNDDNGHGTHCAGIAAGIGHKEVYGVARGCNLYAVKVVDSAGAEKGTSILAGMTWCLQNKIQVISMSLGYKYDPTLAFSQAIGRCQNNGITVVCATGNSHPIPFPYVNAPANSFIPGDSNASPIAVGAINKDQTIASFSCRGTKNDKWNPVTVVAPGVNIYSTYLNNGYTYMNGTSMACPHVAGLAALILEKYPKCTPYGVKQKIIAGANALGYAPYPNEAYGYGIINCQQSTS